MLMFCCSMINYNKMNNSRMCCIMVLMRVISISLVINLVDAQVLPSCGNQVLPCIAYVNSSNPPDICCDPIKDLYETQKTCFCQIVLTPGLFETFGFKISQVFRVIHLCGVEFDTTCKGMSNENTLCLILFFKNWINAFIS